MSYLAKSLGKDEEVVLKASFPLVLHILTWLALLLLGIVLIGLIIFIRAQIWFATTELAVTDRRVLIKRGWLQTFTHELSLDSIELVEIRQTFWEKLFGFGRLEISGTGKGEIFTPPISRPVEFRKAISDAAEAHSHHQATVLTVAA